MSDETYFPSYTRWERLADAAIHAAGVPLGIVAGGLLLARSGPDILIPVSIYVFGLVFMLSASAAYQLAQPSRLKEWLRRIDRCAIFVMIAGTYTPISVTTLSVNFGFGLCALQWGLAAAGIALTLKFPRKYERAMLGLYFLMGWLLIVLIRYAWAELAPNVLALIVAGGLAYTVGAFLQRSRMKFHNPVWHFLVLLAASLQYAAIALQLTGTIF